jgi:hypothetical protein
MNKTLLWGSQFSLFLKSYLSVLFEKLVTKAEHDASSPGATWGVL